MQSFKHSWLDGEVREAQKKRDRLYKIQFQLISISGDYENFKKQRKKVAVMREGYACIRNRLLMKNRVYKDKTKKYDRP